MRLKKNNKHTEGSYEKVNKTIKKTKKYVLIKR